MGFRVFNKALILNWSERFCEIFSYFLFKLKAKIINYLSFFKLTLYKERVLMYYTISFKKLKKEMKRWT